MGKAFQKRGLQVIFTLLCNPGLAAEPYRTIMAHAGVAIGTIVTVMKDLKILNFLQEKGKGNRHLVRTTDLLNRWVAAYPEKLRPGLLKGRYTAKDPLWWQKPELEDARLGGEAAAAFLTGRLKPAGATLYAKTNLGRLVVKNRFTADNDGTIDILKRFWNFEYDWPHRELAPPLLIYADLLATGDARAIETAKVIYDRFLVGSIGQD